LVVHWDGSRWTDVAAPGTPSGDVLDDVYCHPGVGCLVLGPPKAVTNRPGNPDLQMFLGGWVST
jgi:hypothetical protein